MGGGGGGGDIHCSQVFRSLIPGSRYLVTSSGGYGKVFDLLLLYLIYNVLIFVEVCYNLIFRVTS